MSTDSFTLNNYDLIGFDLDNCLVEYNYERMSNLIYNILCRYLVREKGYNPALALSHIDFDFLQKGLFLDFKCGNIVKLDSTGKVVKACHGTQKIANLCAFYGENCIWEPGKKYVSDPLAAWNGPLSEEIRAVLDFFDMPTVMVFARLVDMLPESNFQNLWQDILSGLQYMYNTDGFSRNEGEYYPALSNSPTDYIKVLPKETVKWLKGLRQRKGKFVCLITGSAHDFANFTSSIAISSQWKKMFDMVIFFARKPAFFIQEREFIDSDTLSICSPMDDVKLSQGNWAEIKKIVSQRLCKTDIKSVYIGDNLIQDVLAPVSHGECDAVAICDRIVTEGGVSPIWGAVSEVADGVPTFWHSVLSQYASLTVPSVNDLINL